MTEDKEKKSNEKKTLSLSSKLDPKKVTPGQVRQNFSHGRSKSVDVQVKKRRIITKPTDAKPEAEPKAPESNLPPKPKGLTTKEWESRVKALRAAADQSPASKQDDIAEKLKQERQKEAERKKAEEEERAARLREKEAAEKEAREKAEAEREAAQEEQEISPADVPVPDAKPDHRHKRPDATLEPKFKTKDSEEGKKKEVRRNTPSGRREGKLTLQDALVVSETGDSSAISRQRSQASMQRAREKERKKEAAQAFEPKEIVREVILPETITVQELANRMSERAVNVIKSLMKMGVMATVNQVIDADTAELIVEEFGHKLKRVSDSDVEIGLEDQEDNPKDLVARAPVVTIMGHVDHGKTSLLDAIRKTDVVAKEAGGITQHIGAYQVKVPSTKSIVTFLDTPGHAAFTEMRLRGAKVTDIVILVVAADDSVKEQTIEAINHVKAADVPMIIAINKIDKPGADANKVKNQLLEQEIVVEELGGDVLCVEVSAKQKLNLEGLLEAIHLQAELLDLQANPNRTAQAAVIEARMEQGRGSVATVLVQKGTLNIGDIFVSGSTTGRVRALLDANGKKIKTAGPSMPVEVVGFNETPEAGDDFYVVDSEARAREVAEYRIHRNKQLIAAKSKVSLEDMFAQQHDQDKKELAVVIKGDVQGSVEALVGSFEKLANDEVSIRVLHSGVGGITERDVILANASNGIIIGFNVRANPQARELSRRDNISIRYYSIIYDVIDDVKAALSGLLTPTLREKYLGQAEIRQIYNIPKVGKIAGCMIKEGIVKRGAKVRLLRDDVVIHEGTLKTLRRFKDEVKEVKEGFECGMAFENYQDIKENDQIECFEMEEVKRTL